MASTLASLIIKIGADVKDATSNIATLDGSVKRIKKQFTGASEATLQWRSAMVALGAGGALAAVIKNSMEAQRAVAQLQAVLASTGGVSGQTIQSLNATAAALQKTTIYGDEAVKTAQGILLTFKKIRGEAFDGATVATLNLATALGTDLKSAALQVGKALEDPATQMSYLRRSGVSFTKEQIALAKELQNTGRLAEAQAMILRELETEFGGSAEAARKTLGGALAFLKNQIGDFFEVSESGSGVFISAINSMGEAVIAVREKAMVPFFGGIQQLAAELAVGVGELQVTWARFIRFLGGPDNVQEAMAWVGHLRTGLAEVKAELVSGVPQVQKYRAGIEDVGDEAEKTAEKLRNMLRPGAGVSAPNIALDFTVDPEALARWQRAQENIRNGSIAMWDLRPQAKAFKSSMDDMVDVSRGAKDKMLESAMMFRDGFADAIASAVMTGKLSFKSFTDFVIAELIRIQVRKMFTNVLFAAAGGTSGSTSTSVPTYTGGNAISAPSFNLGTTTAPATVVHQTVNFSVSAVDSRDAARFISEQRGTIAQVVAEAARGSSGYRRALAGA